MTRLATRKTRTSFEVEARIQGRPLIVEAEPHLALLRQKGRRRRLAVSWEAIYWLAAKIAADQAKREREGGKSSR